MDKILRSRKFDYVKLNRTYTKNIDTQSVVCAKLNSDIMSPSKYYCTNKIK